jgi:5-methylcytosine-specific restriction endonuclease McrA
MSYYATKEWKELRDRVLKRDEYKCVECGSTNHLIAHHEIPREDGGADHESNLKTLCNSCHYKAHVVINSAKYSTGKYNPTDEELREMGIGW